MRITSSFNLMLRRSLRALPVAVLAALPAQAATFTYDAVIASVRSSSDATYPAVGGAATVTIDLDGSDPSLPVFDGMGQSGPIIAAFVSVPGFIFGDLPFGSSDSGLQALNLQPDGFFFGSAYGPTSVLQPNGSSFFDQGLHSLRFTYAGPQVVDPDSLDVAGLLALIGAPGASGLFRWEAEQMGGGFDSIDIAFADATAVVPLPATGLLLAGGLLGFGLFRRRRKTQRSDPGRLE